jgi:uncharacterized protein YlzI (FlbEa/FlbD family)
MSTIDEMKLSDTIDFMNSSNYKDRFKAEYYQTRIRFRKLNNMINKYDNGTLEFIPTCSIELLRDQKFVMKKYLEDLEMRAKIEGIDLYNTKIGSIIKKNEDTHTVTITIEDK